MKRFSSLEHLMIVNLGKKGITGRYYWTIESSAYCRLQYNLTSYPKLSHPFHSYLLLQPLVTHGCP